MKIDSPLAFGFREKEGLSHLAWGEEAAVPSVPMSLQFRDFHHPHSRRGGSWNDFPESGQWALREYRQIQEPAAPHLSPLSLGRAEEIPAKKDWLAFCRAIEEELGTGRLQKAVPARSRVFALSAETARRLRSELLPRLFSSPPNGAFRFFLKKGHSWFFGATPEMLFRRVGRSVLVPAIAGTRAFSPGTETAHLGRELLESAKERNEHRLVVEGIISKLAALGLKPTAPKEPTVMRLRSLLHLYTPVHAEGDTSSENLLSLHPTAAVGGAPPEAAQRFLREREPFERGLFASPLLFRFPGQEICLVAIRSALLEGNRLHLFAGAGYVPGSDPEAEWVETGKKMDSLQLLLEEERV